MTDPMYEKIVESCLDHFRELLVQRDKIEADVLRLRQVLYATLPMIPEEKREYWQGAVDEAVLRMAMTSASLAESIRKVFRENPNMGMPMTFVRDMLLKSGFDFSSYTSNPLSSISTTLRRMVETGEMEVREMEGATLFFPTATQKRKPFTGPIEDKRKK
jgi:hypothetical protein